MKSLDNRQNKAHLLKKKGFLKSVQPWTQQFVPLHKISPYARQNIRGKKRG